MNINDSEIKDFINNPHDYVLRLSKGNLLTAERKSVVTWLKAHTFSKNEYKLDRIAAAIRKPLALSSFEKRFVHQLNNKIEKYNRSNKNPIKEVDPKVFEVAKEQASFVKEAVLDHLTPYLEGKITPENEDVNRAPLPSLILEQLKAKYPEEQFDPNLVLTLVFKEYMHIAAWKGCEATASGNGFTHQYPETNNIVGQIIERVRHAVAIDFKGYNIPSNLEDVLKAAIEAYKSQFAASKIRSH